MVVYLLNVLRCCLDILWSFVGGCCCLLLLDVVVCLLLGNGFGCLVLFAIVVCKRSLLSFRLWFVVAVRS